MLDLVCIYIYILESKDTKKNRVHIVEHLVEHETSKVAYRTPRKSFTAVAHGITERTQKNIWCPLFDRSKKTRFFHIYPPFSASKFNCMTNYH